MRILFTLLILSHGTLHVLGCLKAYSPASITALTIPISKSDGILWLFASMLLITAGLMHLVKFEGWWLPGVFGVLLSINLIINFWMDAKWGMIPNLIILMVLFFNRADFYFKQKFVRDVKNSLIQREVHPGSAALNALPLLMEDLIALPDPVRNYIIGCGFVGKPRIKSFNAWSEGVIRSNENSAWIPLKVEQFNLTDPLTRLFYMKGVMKGIPVAGYHRFKEGHAKMDIRLLSLFKVQYQDGKEMDIAETVTYFNDLCVFAPGALPFKTIQWETLDANAVKAVFTEGGITIQAILYFNKHHELVDFESDDRYFKKEDKTMVKIKWTTPLTEYKEYHGYRLAAKAEAVWHFKESTLTYARFDLKDIDYNTGYHSW